MPEPGNSPEVIVVVMHFHWLTCDVKGAARGGAEGAQAPPLTIRILMFIS